MAGGWGNVMLNMFLELQICLLQVLKHISC